MSKPLIKYSDVIKRRTKSSQELPLIIIRNTVIEPILGDYLCYYNNIYDVRYCDAQEFVNTHSNSYAIVLLYLPKLASELYDNFYTLEDEENRNKINNIKSLLKQLFSKISYGVFFNFEYDTKENFVINERSWNDVVREINLYLFDLSVKNPNVQIVDINKIITVYGSAAMLSSRTEYTMGIRYSPEMLGHIAYEAIHCFNYPIYEKKCIILDCDGVLWGGVLVDDGIEHIKLARTGIGSAFRNFQRELVRLHQEGILLCLCSKNHESDVVQIFESHPDMLLKLNHIAEYQIGWNNKAEGILLMASKLNISVDSMVFIDDNRFEIEAVKAMIPEIDTLCLEGKPAYTFIEEIRECGWFNKKRITKEDRVRNISYVHQKQRNEAKSLTIDYNDYLNSLGTITNVCTATSAFDYARIADLSQRTNQFNLSGRRYSENELQEIGKDKTRDIIALSASDKFGDLGLIAASVVHYINDTAIIESFYLSCRAFSRGFEQMLIKYIKNKASEHGCEIVIGIFNETSKNKTHRDFFSSEGLEVIYNGQYKNI